MPLYFSSSAINRLAEKIGENHESIKYARELEAKGCLLCFFLHSNVQETLLEVGHINETFKVFDVSKSFEPLKDKRRLELMALLGGAVPTFSPEIIARLGIDHEYSN